MNEQETREAIALTYGMIGMIDDGIAKILVLHCAGERATFVAEKFALKQVFG